MANSKLFILGIGGTGARVLRSLTMLLASGEPSFDRYDVYPVIIDYDDRNADKERATEILTLYKRTHDDAFQAHEVGQPVKSGVGCQFFGADIKQIGGIKNFTFQFKLPDGETKYSDFIKSDGLSGKTFNTEKLLKSLYDTSTDDDTTELNIDMSVGFKGNPNIGSVVLNDIQRMPLFMNLISSYNRDQEDRIVIIGSLFGGTGASGIPALIQTIKAQKPTAHISTVLVLPYFEPNPKPDGGGAIDARLFYSKTKAAINYYKDSKLNKEIENIYYVGDFYPTHIAYSEGGEDQKNNANIVEFISALAVAHYAKQPTTELQPNTEYKFSVAKSIKVNKSAGEGGSQRLYVQDFIDSDSMQALRNLEILCIAMKFYKDKIVTGIDQTKRSYFDLLGIKGMNDRTKPERTKGKLECVCDDLNKFYDQLYSWMKELDFGGDHKKHLEGNSHRLALFDMKNPYDEMEASSNKGAALESTGIGGKVSSILIGKGSSKQLTDDYIAARMDNHFNDNHMAGNKDLKTEQKEFAFMDILHRAAIDAEEQLKK